MVLIYWSRLTPTEQLARAFPTSNSGLYHVDITPREHQGVYGEMD